MFCWATVLIKYGKDASRSFWCPHFVVRQYSAFNLQSHKLGSVQFSAMRKRYTSNWVNCTKGLYGKISAVNHTRKMTISNANDVKTPRKNFHCRNVSKNAFEKAAQYLFYYLNCMANIITVDISNTINAFTMAEKGFYCATNTTTW